MVSWMELWASESLFDLKINQKARFMKKKNNPDIKIFLNKILYFKFFLNLIKLLCCDKFFYKLL
jgi:hypothetical protein